MNRRKRTNPIQPLTPEAVERAAREAAAIATRRAEAFPPGELVTLLAIAIARLGGEFRPIPSEVDNPPKLERRADGTLWARQRGTTEVADYAYWRRRKRGMHVVPKSRQRLPKAVREIITARFDRPILAKPKRGRT